MTTNTETEVRIAQAVVAIAEANRVMAESVRGHRAGGPTAALELVMTSGVSPRDFAAAAVMAARSFAEAMCVSSGDDVDDVLAGWLDQALDNERVAAARLAELTEGGGDQ